MACDFCRVTPVDPCPVCGPVSHAGNTRIRKLPKALRNAIANAAPEARIRELEAKLRANPTPLAPVSVPPTRANPTPPPPIVRQRGSQPARAAVLTRPTLADDLREAERMVRGLLWPKYLPATIDVKASKVDEEATHPPITRGDFRGLWVAVEAGHLTEAAAIELAASWKGVPA